MGGARPSAQFDSSFDSPITIDSQKWEEIADSGHTERETERTSCSVKTEHANERWTTEGRRTEQHQAGPDRSRQEQAARAHVHPRTRVQRKEGR